jgi:hypothetical protein
VSSCMATNALLGNVGTTIDLDGNPFGRSGR